MARDIEAAKRELNDADRIIDPFRRQLYAVGVITRALAVEGIRPILVGGAAVELYTFGAYHTRDVDLVCPGRPKAAALLEALGFERHRGERHWYHEAAEELSVALDTLRPQDRP